MTTAESIRRYAIKHHIAPARAAGREEVLIRLGEVRQEMGIHESASVGTQRPRHKTIPG